MGPRLTWTLNDWQGVQQTLPINSLFTCGIFSKSSTQNDAFHAPIEGAKTNRGLGSLSNKLTETKVSTFNQYTGIEQLPIEDIHFWRWLRCRIDHTNSRLLYAKLSPAWILHHHLQPNSLSSVNYDLHKQHSQGAELDKQMFAYYHQLPHHWIWQHKVPTHVTPSSHPVQWPRAIKVWAGTKLTESSIPSLNAQDWVASHWGFWRCLWWIINTNST
jgi:hypothetical protein